MCDRPERSRTAETSQDSNPKRQRAVDSSRKIINNSGSVEIPDFANYACNKVLFGV